MTLAVAHASTTTFMMVTFTHTHTHTHTQRHTHHTSDRTYTLNLADAYNHPHTSSHTATLTVSHTQPCTHTASQSPPPFQRGAGPGEVWDWPPALSPAALKGPGNTSLLFIHNHLSFSSLQGAASHCPSTTTDTS